jgi:signal transduction histidine kinase
VARLADPAYRPAMAKRSKGEIGLFWEWQSPDERTKVRAAESYTEFLTAGLLSLAVAATLAYVYLLFEPLAPAPVLNMWAGMMAGWVLYVLAGTLFVYIRKPSPRAMMKMAIYGKVSAVVYDLLLAASVWMLLPYAPEALQLMMVVFFAAAISGQAIATAESFATVAFGVVSVLGSTALFFFLSANAYGVPVGLFILGFGALLLMAAIIIRNSVRSAIKAKLDTDRANADLVVALRQVEEARDTKQRFIAAATHDLRQPLQAAALYLRPLLKAHPESDALHKPLDGLQRSIQSADSLLEDMMTFVRLDAQTLQPMLQSVAIGPVLQNVSRVQAGNSAEKSMKIRFVHTRLCVQADALWLDRILTNLVFNAIRHSDGRTVLLGVRSRRDWIEVWCLDDGRGVAREDAGKIFGEYVRGQQALAKATSGMGLGLASALRMARLMGGDLVHEARWQKGALFRLRLRRADCVTDGKRA